MNVLFLTMVNITTLKKRGIYQDLLNHFIEQGHNVYIVAPVERRHKTKTSFTQEGKANILNVQSLNLTKTNVLEKGLGQILIEGQFLSAIKKYIKNVDFDLVLYSTPPITFSKVIDFIKKRDGAYSYLLLKDIFPQNAVDMGMMKKGGLLHKTFVNKEKRLYKISDTIGCMSEANKKFVLEHNPDISRNKVEVNPNTIKPKFIEYSEEERVKIKNKYNIPIDKRIFVYGGNLGIPQGIDFLIETISDLKEPLAHILVVGSGTQFKKIEIWFNQNKPTNATLLSGLPRDEYDVLLAACDVGMIFLHKDFTIPNFPSRLLAYLEMKMPVLAATDINTDIGKIIEEAKCGYWVEAGDANGIQVKISKLCADNLDILGDRSWNLLQNEYLVERSYNLIVEKINV
ncbi:glycosyl transferase [Aequorivita vladivostokensis]|uniref:Glycosyl transferase n=2 Tax=Aequorivita vladivostokensis TaxID=171194 RepID=A0ABR5DJ80_9FLAO|nr:glycosyl transferase [Aequorivita vladivostokensis]